MQFVRLHRIVGLLINTSSMEFTFELLILKVSSNMHRKNEVSFDESFESHVKEKKGDLDDQALTVNSGG